MNRIGVDPQDRGHLKSEDPCLIMTFTNCLPTTLSIS